MVAYERLQTVFPLGRPRFVDGIVEVGALGGFDEFVRFVPLGSDGKSLPLFIQAHLADGLVFPPVVVEGDVAVQAFDALGAEGRVRVAAHGVQVAEQDLLYARVGDVFFDFLPVEAFVEGFPRGEVAVFGVFGKVVDGDVLQVHLCRSRGV